VEVGKEGNEEILKDTEIERRNAMKEERNM
jgi:hypothetical protein